MSVSASLGETSGSLAGKCSAVFGAWAHPVQWISDTVQWIHLFQKKKQLSFASACNTDECSQTEAKGPKGKEGKSKQS